MSELALQLIAENKKTKATELYLRFCDLAQLPPQLSECVWLKDLYLNDNRGLSDLSPLKDWQNLQKLSVDSTQVSDLSPLKDLQKLQQLSISNTQLSDLSPLKDLQNLQLLDVSSTQVSDLSPLKDLKNLQELNVSDTQVSDWAPVKDLQNLQELDIARTQVSDLAPLKDLRKLQKLNVRGTQVSDLSPLKDLKNLQELYVHSTPVSDLSPLKDLKKLQKLYVHSTPVSDLSPLKDLKNLQELNVSDTQVSDWAPVKDLQNLQELDMARTQVSDLAPLKDLRKLQKLNVRGTQVSDLAPLKDLKKLQKLDIHSTPVSDLVPLKDLKNLQMLYISHTQVSDLAPLKNLENLYFLEAYDTIVSDLIPLKNLLRLRALYVFETKISDLLPLKDLLNLTTLYISRTQVSDLSPLKYLNNLDEIRCGGCSIKTVPPEIAFSRNGHLIREYLLSNPDTPFNEIKLILTGNTEAGKTNLADFLCLGEAFQFQEEHDSTHGILVRRWEVGPELLPRDTALDRLGVNIWDFGGQDFYHGTHSMFFRQGAVFALLWVKDKAKEKHYDEEALQSNRFVCFPEDYWLDNIRHHIFDSPVLCVQNKTDRDGLANLPEAWQQHYNIAANEVFHLSIRNAVLQPDSEFADEWVAFRKKLIRRLAEIPAREEIKIKGEWLQLRDFIRELQTAGQKISPRNPFQAVSPDRPYLTLAEFEQCCEQVYPEFVQFAKPFLHLFDQRGVLIHFANHKTLGDYVFLNPDWVARKIYSLLDKELLERKEGTFDRDYARQHLSDDAELLLALMLEYGIIYPEPRKADAFVAVQYLPPFDRTKSADFHYEKRLPAPALKIRLPLFHQQRIMRQLLVRLGSDQAYEQHEIRRDCILLGDAGGSLIRIEGEQEENRGVITIFAEKEEWAVQMWLEVMMIYFSSFQMFDVSPISREGGKIDKTFEHYRKQIRRYFDNDGDMEDFVKIIDEAKRPNRYWGDDSMMAIPVHPFKLPTKQQVAQIWGLLFLEKLEGTRLNWKAAKETENYPEPHKKQSEQTERMFEAYAVNCWISTDGAAGWVEFSALLKNAFKPNVPDVKDESVTIKPFLPYLKALGYDMEKQPLKVFISYSHAQHEYFPIFKKDFEQYSRLPGLDIEVFGDDEIPIGAAWDEYLQGKVAGCDVMILLVSQEFMNSKYIQEKEFGAAVQRLKGGGEMLIAPVYFAPCLFENDAELSRLQFFKPHGEDFDQARKGNDFSYIDLVKFRETDGMPIPNANRQHYMKKLMEKLKPQLLKL